MGRIVSDYDRIATAIKFISSRTKDQPTLAEIAGHLHMSPSHFQRLFCRWAGVSPKRFLQILTVERAKELLRKSKSVFDTSDALGLSSGSRLYDHFVQIEAVTPGEFKNGGINLNIEYAIHDTPFGKAFVATTTRGVCQLEFLDYSDIKLILSDLSNKWPRATIHENDRTTQAVIAAIFSKKTRHDQPLSLQVSGTNFQLKVWKALLQIPPGTIVSYSQIASKVGRPRSARAVGTAIGANPVALLIPCHRVIQQSGKLGGYHWGETRLHAIHAWESVRSERPHR